MRLLVIGLSALTLAATMVNSHALTLTEGKVVRGSYTAGGRVLAAGVRVTYNPARVRVTINGRLRGTIVRTVQAGSGVTQDVVSVSGKVRSLKVLARKGTFTAPAVIRVGGAAFRGNFNGLSDPSQKPSRFFRGKVNGVKKSSLTLRSA